MVVEKLLRKVLVDPLLWTLMLSLPLALLPSLVVLIHRIN